MRKQKDPRIDYLVKPFLELVNSEKFCETRTRMHIFCGVTGQGKTYTCIHDWIPELLSKGLKLIVYSVPFNEIRQDEEFENMALNNSANISAHVVYDFDKARRILKNKQSNPVILIVTNQNWTGNRGKMFQKWIISNIKTTPTAFFLDESHTWLVSCNENYRNDC